MSVAPPGGQNRIMIYGPKGDGTYIVEFRTAAGEALAISIPRSEASVVRHFQERMPFASSTRNCARSINGAAAGEEALMLY